jgi:hypothetical protein
MPRTSAAALAVVPLTAPKPPAPPDDLTPTQARVWQDIVATRPADHFDEGSRPLLVEYCRHCDAANAIARLIEQTDPSDLQVYGKLLGMQVRESAALSMLAAKLRLSPSSFTRVAKRVTKPTGRKWAPIT